MAFASSFTRRSLIAGALSSPAILAQQPSARARITRITLAPLQGRFHKFVAMNSYDTAPKGHTYEHTLIRIFTNDGIQGIGAGTYSAPDAAAHEALRQLIGADPVSVYQHNPDGTVSAPAPEFSALLSRYPHLDGPLFDLIGKLTRRPAWQLVGPSVRDHVEAYDGTLYFSDVWFSDRGVRAVVEEVEEALKKGYLGVKLKLGRGWKWMEKDAGLARDIEVVNTVRRAAGPGVKVMGDPNNGFRDDFDRAWRLLEQTRSSNLYWIEEPFPESVAGYTQLKTRLQEANMPVRIADGENFRTPAEFDPYLTPRRLIDVLQLDIRQGGFLAGREVARKAREAGAVAIPHNWASQIGLCMGLHLAKACAAVVAAEDDRSTCDVLHLSGYRFRSGMYEVSSNPGLGIEIDEQSYRAKCKPREIVIS